MSYQVFTRTWWKRNQDWPNGLEPHCGERRNQCIVNTPAEARAACKRWHDDHYSRNAPKPLSANDKRLGLDAEYEKI